MATVPHPAARPTLRATTPPARTLPRPLHVIGKLRRRPLSPRLRPPLRDRVGPVPVRLRSCSPGEDVLRPDGLARTVGARAPVPARSQTRYEEQPTARLFGTSDVGDSGAPGDEFGTGVGDLDADGAAVGRGVHAEVKVATGNMAVPHGVRGQLSHDQHDLVMVCGVVRDAPRVQAYSRQAAGESGTAGCGGEAHLEGAVAEGFWRRDQVWCESGELSGGGAVGLGRHADNGALGGVA